MPRLTASGILLVYLQGWGIGFLPIRMRRLKGLAA
jgi:hypothetical protein